MEYPTTASVRRPSPLFAPGGAQWVAVPVGLDGPALHVWIALLRATRGQLATTIPDRVLADLTDRSERYVQAGLKQLEAEGLITRQRRHGGRTITITVKLAGKSEHEHRSARTPQTDSHRPAPPIRTSPPPPLKRDNHGGKSGSVRLVEEPTPAWEDMEPAHRAAMRRFFGAFCPVQIQRGG